MLNHIRNYKIFAPAIVIFFIDQITKYLISINMDENSSIEVISYYLKFYYLSNPGAAFGIPIEDYELSGILIKGEIIYLVLFLLTLLITAYLIFYLFTKKDNISYEYFSLSLILGGALGNLLDRAFTVFGIAGYHGVIDFIDIGLKDDPSWRWYVFNVADMSVSIGIFLFLLSSYNFSQTKSKINNDNS